MSTIPSNKKNGKEKLVNGKIISNRKFKKILSISEFEIECDMTSVSYETESIYLNCYVYSDGFSKDFELILNDEVIGLTEYKKQLALIKMIEYRENNTEQAENDFDGDYHSYFGVRPEMFFNPAI